MKMKRIDSSAKLVLPDRTLDYTSGYVDNNDHFACRNNAVTTSSYLRPSTSALNDCMFDFINIPEQEETNCTAFQGSTAWMSHPLNEHVDFTINSLNENGSSLAPSYSYCSSNRGNRNRSESVEQYYNRPDYSALSSQPRFTSATTDVAAALSMGTVNHGLSPGALLWDPRKRSQFVPGTPVHSLDERALDLGFHGGLPSKALVAYTYGGFADEKNVFHAPEQPQTTISSPQIQRPTSLQCSKDMEYQTNMQDEETVEDDAEGSEPYAKLIHKALMSRSDRQMALKEIYDWFENNTDKCKNEGKGWQNSIRHNLSMNGAFQKTEPQDLGRDSKKNSGYTWVLTEEAVRDGVKSTTRYRKSAANKKFVKSENPEPKRQISGRKGGQASRALRLREKTRGPRGTSQILEGNSRRSSGPSSSRIAPYPNRDPAQNDLRASLALYAPSTKPCMDIAGDYQTPYAGVIGLHDDRSIAPIFGSDTQLVDHGLPSPDQIYPYVSSNCT